MNKNENNNQTDDGKVCVIPDTNIVKGKFSDLNKIKEELKDVVDIYLPQLVIEEYISIINRDIKSDYDEVEKKINDRNFDYNKNFDIKKLIKSRERDLKKKLNDICDNRIIPYSDDILNTILSKCINKKPPFSEKTDKGFKDAVIWESILKSKDIDKYEYVYFVSNDKEAFITSKDILIKEYRENHINKFEILDSMDKLKTILNIVEVKENGDKIKESLSDKKYEEIVLEMFNDTLKDMNKYFNEEYTDNLRERLNKCFTKIFYEKANETYSDADDSSLFQIVYIFKPVDEIDVSNIMDNLGIFLRDYLLSTNVPIRELFRRCNIDSTDDMVLYKDLKELYDIYNEIKDNDELYGPFIKFMVYSLNELYTTPYSG